MKLVSQRSDIRFDKNSIVTVGSFDGVHRAHQEIIHQVVERARDRKGRSVVITFDPHPREVIGKASEPFELLTTTEEKRKLMETMGVDVFFVITFDYEFSRLGPRDFYMSYLVNGIGVSEVVEGYDHHFGRDQEGSVEALMKLGKEFEFSITAVTPVYVGGEVVSSTGIRKHLHNGEVDQAAELLGRPYAIQGTVVRGDGRGRTLGFPTANIRPASAKKLVPKNGIYFVKVQLPGDRRFGMASIGVRPTFHANGERVVEVNILDFSDDLYDKNVEVFFLKRMRDELKFDSSADLIQQMQKDKELSQQLQREFHHV